MRELFKFNAHTPALPLLFQLPPAMGSILRRIPLLRPNVAKPAAYHSAYFINALRDVRVSLQSPLLILSRSPHAAKITQLICKPYQHSQLLMANIKIRCSGFLVVALLRFNDQRVHVVASVANLLSKAVFLVLREVVKVDIQLRRELHIPPIQRSF
nr:hypothetical protein [Spongiibacter marinus]